MTTTLHARLSRKPDEGQIIIVKKFLSQYSTVRIRQLLDAHADHDGWRVNQRPPKAGDVGVLVDVLTSAGSSNKYVVECVDANGMTTWLSDFFEDELEVVPKEFT